MKHIALASAFLLATICGTLIAQNPVQFQPTTIDPTGRACNSTQGNLRTPSGTLYTCQNGLMAKASNAGGGGPPSGKAGGDLSGSYPNPSVAKINGANPPLSAGVVGTNSSRQIVAVPGTPSDCVHVDGSSSACSPSGAVIGPASAIDSSIVLYDGTTGKLVKAGSGCTIASGVITCAAFNSNDTSHSGVSIYNGLTSGTVALGAADIAGTAIVYVLPSTNGTAGQVLTDSGSTTCPTFAAGAPATCHLLAWVTASSLSGVVPTSRSISTTSPLGGGGTLSGDLTLTCSTCVTNALATRNIGAAFGGFQSGATPLSASLTSCVPTYYSGTITSVELIGDVSGSVTVDVKTVAHSSWTGTSSASSITAAAIPALSSASRYTDSTLTGWTTSVTAGTDFCFVLTSPTTVAGVSINLKITGTN